MVDDLWKKGEQEVERSWKSMRELWKRWHNVDFTEFAQNEMLLGFIEARNSFAHGRGRLTRLQARRDGGVGVRETLKKCGITVLTDGHLLTSDRTVKDCRQAVTGLVTWLDGEVNGRLRLLGIG